MIIFCAGNYYRVKPGTTIGANDRAQVARWIKAKRKFSSNYYVYHVTGYVALSEAEAKAQGLT
jgi:hypothetical protein